MHIAFESCSSCSGAESLLLTCSPMIDAPWASACTIDVGDFWASERDFWILKFLTTHSCTLVADTDFAGIKHCNGAD